MHLFPSLSGAQIDGEYRYSLWRTLRATAEPKRVLFIMLNPSTADATKDDPTLRRCLGFAKSWGYDELEVCNLFAFRATDPKLLLEAADPIGPANDEHIERAVHRASLVVAAWGAHGGLKNRAAYVTEMVTKWRSMHCLGLTGQGFPRHPLYVQRQVQPVLFTSRDEAGSLV